MRGCDFVGFDIVLVMDDAKELDSRCDVSRRDLVTRAEKCFGRLLFELLVGVGPMDADTSRQSVTTQPMMVRQLQKPTVSHPVQKTRYTDMDTGAETTMKRFWKNVGIEPQGDALTVTLDSRPLKTPSGNRLLLPKNKGLVATLVAAEWEHQRTVLKPHALPMVCTLHT